MVGGPGRRWLIQAGRSALRLALASLSGWGSGSAARMLGGSFTFDDLIQTALSQARSVGCREIGPSWSAGWSATLAG